MGGGLVQPTSTPIPPGNQSIINGDISNVKSASTKTVRWSATDEEIFEIQKASIAIGK